MFMEQLEKDIAETFKKYKHLSESTKISDENRLEKVGNHLEYLLQLKKNLVDEDKED